MSKEGEIAAFKALQAEWEAKLKMPAKLPKEKLGKKVRMRPKSEAEETAEDDGKYHNPLCPIILGHGLNDEVDQTGTRSVEDTVIGKG